MNEIYTVIVICYFCDGKFEIEVSLPLNDEERDGWICENCADELEKEAKGVHCNE